LIKHFAIGMTVIAFSVSSGIAGERKAALWVERCRGELN
jgi:hypothetical protein